MKNAERSTCVDFVAPNFHVAEMKSKLIGKFRDELLTEPVTVDSKRRLFELHGFSLLHERGIEKIFKRQGISLVEVVAHHTRQYNERSLDRLTVG